MAPHQILLDSRRQSGDGWDGGCSVGQLQGVGSWETLFVLLRNCATILVESSQGGLTRGARSLLHCVSGRSFCQLLEGKEIDSGPTLGSRWYVMNQNNWVARKEKWTEIEEMHIFWCENNLSMSTDRGASGGRRRWRCWKRMDQRPAQDGLGPRARAENEL